MPLFLAQALAPRILAALLALSTNSLGPDHAERYREIEILLREGQLDGEHREVLQHMRRRLHALLNVGALRAHLRASVGTRPRSPTIEKRPVSAMPRPVSRWSHCSLAAA